MSHRSTLAVIVLVLTLGLPSWCAGYTTDRPDGHAPIGVMGDHVHHAGEWMLSYRFMFMRMADNRDGTDRLSTSDVLADFPVAPINMNMEMHMLSAMYAPTDRLTLMAMLPVIHLSMDHRTRMGAKFTTRSTGPGDFRLTGLYRIWSDEIHSLHLNAGLSMPTGSVNERDDTPAADDAKLPYPMQLGSGTWDLLPGVTYLGQLDRYSWGFQPLGTLRLATNSEDYRLGRRIDMSLWGAYRFLDWLSASIRLNSQIWFNLHGKDPELNPAMVPTADPDRRGGRRLDLLFGLNGSVPSGMFKGLRIAVEGGLPVYQSLDGPQLETDYLVTAGLQYAFSFPSD